MLTPILRASIAFACFVSLFSMSLALVWTRTGVCNFAAADMGVISIYVILVAIRLGSWGFYPALLLGIPVSGIFGLVVWLAVMKPLKARGATSEELMIATLGLSLFIGAMLNIIGDTLVTTTAIQKVSGFTLNAPFPLVGTTLAFFGPLIFLHLLFTRTDIGIALKAVGYNPDLAESVGVNTENLYRMTWIFAGVLAALAASFYSLQYRAFPTLGATTLIVTIFTAVILGGTKGIYDAIAGSWIIAFAQVWLVNKLVGVVGAGILPYRITVPLILLVIVLLVFPGGLVEIEWKRLYGTLKGYVKGGVTK